MAAFKPIDDADKLTPPILRNAPRRIRCKLETASDITYQAKLLYRRALAGDISPETAGKLSFILQTIARLHEVSEIERRLDEVEGGLK